MLHKCGLLRAGSENLIPYASGLYKYERNQEVVAGFARTFARPCGVHFLGLWDTVSTIGWIYDPQTRPYTAVNPSVSIVRHAVAIDERRCFFRQNMVFPANATQDILQVWFPGVHSDVGGGYPEKESGLSQVALEWMLGEAKKAGMRVAPAREDDVLGRTARSKYCKPDPNAKAHESLTGFWRICELLPRSYKDMHEHPPTTKWKIPMGRRRYVPADAILSSSLQAPAKTSK